MSDPARTEASGAQRVAGRQAATTAARTATTTRTCGSSFSALGVVYGDIGTSPLYAMRECLNATAEYAVSGADPRVTVVHTSHKQEL